VYVEMLEYFLRHDFPRGAFQRSLPVHAARSRQSSARTLLFGLLMVVGTGIFDLVVASHRLWGYGQLSPLGFLFFVMCMAWGLGKRFADSLRRQRELSAELNGLLMEQRRFSDSLDLGQAGRGTHGDEQDAAVPSKRRPAKPGEDGFSRDDESGIRTR
jgi:hypothetical protein